MEIDALVKSISLSNYGWIHEEGLVVVSKIVEFEGPQDTLFVVYNVDRDEYGVAGGSQFVAVSEKMFYMPAMFEESEFTGDIVIEIIEDPEGEHGYGEHGYFEIEEISDEEDEVLISDEEYEMLNREIKEAMEFEHKMASNLSFKDDEADIEIESLFDLYDLIDMGWEEDVIDKLIEDLIALQSKQDENDL